MKLYLAVVLFLCFVGAIVTSGLGVNTKACVNSGVNLRNGACGSVVRTTTSSESGTVISSERKSCSFGTYTWVGIRLSNGQTVYAAEEAGVKSCPSTPTPTPAPAGNKAAEALKEIFSSEGQCQNWSSDSGNSFQGKIGWTCQGLIPSVCWNNRFNNFQYANPNSYKGHPADFCKYAYDLNRSAYSTAAAQIYTNNYFGPGGCNPLPQPAFYVCADIAVNSGTGRSQQYLRELGGLTSTTASGIKSYARKLNDRHRQDYIRWSASGPNAKFRQGWLNRAAHRDAYINAYPL